MSAPASHPTTDQAAAAISEGLLRIHGESYGVGAATAKTHVTEDAVICFLDNLELLPYETFMISQGQAELILEMRGRYQDVIGPAFIATVERATGRRVTNFFSETALDPLFSVELFRLAPQSTEVLG